MSVFNENHKILREIIYKEDQFERSVKICLEQHAFIHSSQMSGTDIETQEDKLWLHLNEETFKKVKKGHKSIAYHIWHTTRIEDITMNLLVAGSTQVLNDGNWLDKINSTIKDTGNSMQEEEIAQFSNGLHMKPLKEYRMAVGRKTRDIILNLRTNDMKRKVEQSQLQRIIDEGAVLQHEASIWLIDFWRNKNVAGILLMPATRHQLVHLNEALRIKGKDI